MSSNKSHQDTNVSHDRAVCMAEFRDLTRNLSDYTLGQTIFSVINGKYLEEGKSLEFLLNITDKEMYKMISESKEKEQKETEYFNGGE